MLLRELDIVHILKSIRKFSLVKNVILQKNQRKLIKYFKNNVIPQSGDPTSLQPGKADNILAVLGCLNKLVQKEEMSTIDKKVLKGLVETEDF